VSFLTLELIQLQIGKEEAFAHDFLAFASKKLNATVLDGWTVLVEHVSDVGWIDLFDVARHSGQTAGSWPSCDCWSFAWDQPVGDGWVHLKSRARRRRLAAAMELTNFDAALAARAVEHDVVIFLNDSYATYNANLFQREDYLLYLVSHELQHFCDDWTCKQLVRDDVPPSQDAVVLATLNEFARSLGGLEALKQRYT
jgi:hypothetical protein